MVALQREAFGSVASQPNNHQHGSPRTANVPHEHWHTDGCGSLNQNGPSLARRSLHLRPVQDLFSLLSIWALSKVHFDMQTKTLYKISGEEETMIEKIRSYTDSSSYLRKSKIEAVQRAKPMKLEVDLGLKASETISSLMKKTYSPKLWLYLPPFSPGGFVKHRLRKLYSVWVPSSQQSEIWTLSSPAGALGGWRPLLCGYFVSFMGNTDSIYI